MNSKESAERIRQLLAKRDMSARDLARRAGLGESSALANAIRRLAEGKTINATTLATLAKALGVTEQWIMYGGDDPTDDPTDEREPEPPETESNAEPPADEVLPPEMPETLGQRRDYARQEAAAKRELAKRGESVEEWVWPHVRATNNFTLENSAPGVAMLCELARFIASFGDPSAKPKR